MFVDNENSKDDLVLNTTPEKQDKTSKLSKHWSPDSTPEEMNNENNMSSDRKVRKNL